MAKIPSFNSQVRVSQGGYQQLNSPSQARMMGEAVGKLGEGVAKFGTQIDEYMKEKQKVDDALFVAELRNEAYNMGTEAENFAKTNPNAARDGSSAQADFDQAFSPIKEKVTGMEDRRRRAMALQVISEIENSHKNKILTYQVNRHNDYVLEKSNDVLNGMTARVQQDPSQTVNVLQEFDALESQMPLEGDNKKSFMSAGRRSIILASMESFASKGDYQSADDILNKTAAASLFSTEDRVKLSKELKERYRQDRRFTWATENQEHTKMKRERADLFEKTSDTLFQQLIEADADPVARADVIKDAQTAVKTGLLNRSGYEALIVSQDKIDKAQSTGIRQNMVVSYFQGKTIDELKPLIEAEMKAGRMTHQDGMAVLRDIRTQSKREQADPHYKQQKELAKQYIQSRVVPSGYSYAAWDGKEREKQLLVEVNMEVMKLEAKGYDPMTAAKIATARVVGIQSFRESSNPAISARNDSIEELSKYGAQIKERYLKASKDGKMTDAAKQKVKEELLEISERINTLKLRQEYEPLLKLDKPVSKAE